MNNVIEQNLAKCPICNEKATIIYEPDRKRPYYVRCMNGFPKEPGCTDIEPAETITDAWIKWINLSNEILAKKLTVTSFTEYLTEFFTANVDVDVCSTEGHEKLAKFLNSKMSCNMLCGNKEPYGFVPEAGCAVHD